MSRTCVFIDGENFRHALRGLFDNFGKSKYLPKGKWDELFDWLVARVSGKTCNRVRAYWYVVARVDPAPHYIPDPSKPKEVAQFDRLVKKSERLTAKIEAANEDARDEKKREIFEKLMRYRRKMAEREKQWTRAQEQIELDNHAVEFRRAGSIRYDLLTGQLGQEKAVDVNLAVDLITLKDIYETAVIVSGDQDYTPAVAKIKEHGKTVWNVAFKTRSGKLLPGGARRLNIVTDSVLEVGHKDLSGFLDL